MKRKLIAKMIWAGCLAAVVSSNAQDASTAAPVLPPPPKWETSVGLGFTLTRGNSETVLFTATFQTEKKTKENEFVFGADGAYGESQKVRNTAYQHAFGQYNHLFNDRFFGYLRADLLHDDIARIAYRASFSPGIGYYFIKTKSTILAGEVGPGVVTEKQGGVSRTYATMRLAERFEHKFENKARIWQSLELLPDLSRFSNYIINFEVGVDAPIGKNLSLSVVFQDTYDNEPAEGRKCNDMKLISGLKYKF